MRLPDLAGLVALVVSALLAGLAPRPQSDNSVDSFLRGGDEAGFARYDAFVAKFGSDEVVVVSCTATSAEQALRASKELTDRLDELGARVSSIVGAPTLFEAQTDVLLDEGLGGFSNFDRLAWSFDGPLNQALHLFEPKAHRATVYVGLPRGGPSEREALTKTLDEFRRWAVAGSVQVHAAGNPLVNLALDRASKQLEATSLPLLIAVCVLVLLISTRSLRVTLAVLTVVGLGVLGGEGLLGLSGRTTNLIVNISKPLTFVLLLASALHIVVAFRMDPDEDRNRAAAQAARKKTRATVLALLTTAVGFASLISSPVSAMKTFGLSTAAALVLGMPLLVLALPLLLGRFGGRPRADHSVLQGRAAERLVALGRKAGVFAPLVSVGLIAAGLLSFGHLKTDPHAVRYFPADHPLRADHEALEAMGFGLSTLEAVVSSTRTMPRRAQMGALSAFAEQAKSISGVRGVIHLGTFLAEASYRSSREAVVPDDLFIDAALRDNPDRFAPFFDRKTGDLRISFAIDTLDASQIADLEQRLSESFAATLEPRGYTLELTGNYPLIANAQASLIKTLSRSIFTTAIILELIFILALGSIRLGLAALLPNALPVCTNFLVMVGFGVPLDIGTCMTGAIALGIAVDNTLHFLVSHQSGESIELTARSTGRAMVTSSLVVSAGFFALVTADFGPTRNFGALCASALVVALAADLLVLPPILDRLFPARNEP